MIRALAAALGLSALVSPAEAETRGDGGWAFEVGAATDNRSKDASKSEGDPYVHGAALWSSDGERFYAGVGFETIEASTGAPAEVQAIVGVRPQVAAFDLDLKAVFKQHIDARSQADDENWEFTADISRDLGAASARLQLQASPDGSGTTGQWTWIEGRLGWDFTDRLTGTAAIGRREQQASVDYTGWNVGLTWIVSRAVGLDLRWYDTDADQLGEQYGEGLVAALDWAF